MKTIFCHTCWHQGRLRQ